MAQEDRCTLNRVSEKSCLVFHGTMFIFDIHYFTFQKKKFEETVFGEKLMLEALRSN